MLTLFYPSFNPVFFSVGPLKIHWYGLSYAVGIFLAWRYCIWIIRKNSLTISEKHLSDYIPWLIFGIVIGGRLGIAFFYHFDYYIHHLIEILYIWRPGMSFHGALLGVVFVTLFYCYYHRLPLLELSDLLSIGAPIGIFFGRCANFINGELWGRPTDGTWGMIFSHVDALPRHPSQLYEAFFEGIVLFFILYGLMARTQLRQNSPGFLSGIFFIGYGCFRVFIECFREPDAHVGYLIGETTLGQWLSFPLILSGILLIFLSRQKKTNDFM